MLVWRFALSSAALCPLSPSLLSRPSARLPPALLFNLSLCLSVSLSLCLCVSLSLSLCLLRRTCEAARRGSAANADGFAAIAHGRIIMAATLE